VTSAWNTLSELLDLRARETPEAQAILGPGRPPLTYAGLAHQAARVQACLNKAGLGREDRIGIILPNGPDMAAAFLAVASCATCAPLNPAYGAEELRFYLSDLGARAMILPMGSAPQARQVAEELGLQILDLESHAGTPAGFFELRTPIESIPGRPGPAQEGDLAMVLHTSGTTSRPKLVPLTQAQLMISARNIQRSLVLGPQDRCLNIMPLFHVHGLVAALLASLASGGSVACLPGFSETGFFEGLAAFAPTWTTGVPTMHQALLEGASRYPERMGSHGLRFIRSCSAALPPVVMAALEAAFNVPVIEAYGMTEGAHQIASNPLPPAPRKPGSVGLAAGAEVAIMDERGTLLPAAAPGEVVVRGPNVMAGYERRPEANAEAFTHGWFRTGDQGFLDKNGYLFLTGRLKELINRGGMKVSPREVDEVFLTHPAVRQAVAFGVPHPRLGEGIVVAIVLKPGFETTESGLIRYAAAQLANFKLPQQIVFVPEIPKGPTGKLQRIGLGKLLADAMRRPRVAPTDALEGALADLWRQILKEDELGIHDNFFALGGDSILAAQVLARLPQAFGLEVPIRCFFERPTIAELAVLLRNPDPGLVREAAPEIRAQPRVPRRLPRS